MATTKISSTKSTSRAINYAEKRAVEKSGLNCDVEYAKSSFKQIRELYNKTGGNEGHVVIQSFKPGEVTEKQCNQLGLELAEKIAPNHQVTVYTHNDKEHIHNHIVINSVNLETGKKFNNNKQALRDIRQASDEVCKAHGLSVIKEQNSPVRYTQAERAILEKGQSSWKDELRKAINIVKSRNSDFESFQSDLASLGIETKKRGSTVSYLHPNAKKWVRAKRLGSDYELGGLENEFGRFNQSREWKNFEQNTSERRTERDNETERTPKRQNGIDREVSGEQKQANTSTNKRVRRYESELEL